MELKGILAISGYSGLFKLVKQSQSGIIVESLETKKRMPAYATTKITSLEDSAVFLENEQEISLVDVLKNIYEKEEGGQAINHKSDAAKLKAYFAEVLPEYDKERVYVSDIKKIISWYNTLQKYDMLDFSEAENKEEAAETEKTDKDKTPAENASQQTNSEKEDNDVSKTDD